MQWDVTSCVISISKDVYFVKDGSYKNSPKEVYSYPM